MLLRLILTNSIKSEVVGTRRCSVGKTFDLQTIRSNRLHVLGDLPRRLKEAEKRDKEKAQRKKYWDDFAASYRSNPRRSERFSALFEMCEQDEQTQAQFKWEEVDRQNVREIMGKIKKFSESGQYAAALGNQTLRSEWPKVRRALLIIFHPDKHAVSGLTKEEAEETTKLINNAYDEVTRDGK